MGLHNLWIFWYFIYLMGMGVVNLIAFFTGLLKGFDGNDFVQEYEAAQAEWYSKIITDFLY